VNLLDLLLLTIVGGSIVLGFFAGFARAGLGFISVIAGVLLGFWFYGIPAAWIHRYVHSSTFSNLAGFFAVFLACAVAGALIGKILSRLFKWTGLSWLDRLMGAGFGFVRGAIAAVAFVAVLMAFTPKPVPKWMTGSYLLPYAIDASNAAASIAPRALKESVRQTVGEIRQAWEDEVRKSDRREPKKEKEPKSPPPKAVNQ
jgi:membrane protein required for colicin V production